MNPFQNIRNYLAGQVVGITRDDALLHELLKLILCISTVNNVKSKQYQELIKVWPKIRSSYPSLFQKSEQILINEYHFENIVDWLLEAVANENSDIFGDLYEVFSSDISKAAGGQYFTPMTAVDFLVNVIDPKPNEKIIDPACGAGGFLARAAEYKLNNGESRKSVASTIGGIEKDEYLANLALSRIGILTGHPSNLINGDSLALKSKGASEINAKHLEADIVLTNPPFGAKIVAASQKVLREFELGYKHKNVKGKWTATSEIQSNVSPQVLFVERIISLIKPGGRVGMVLPESLISSKSHGYVVQYLRKHLELIAVIGMPESLFKLSGKTGTHTKTVLVIARKPKSKKDINQNPIFMAEVSHVGKDSRGRTTPINELPEVLKRLKSGPKKIYKDNPNLGYWVNPTLIRNDVLAPRYYDPESEVLLNPLKKSHDLISVSELLSTGVIEIRTGDEVGRLSYGTGDIPFVRTSDISNWEIKFDPKHCVSEQVYVEFAKRQDIKTNDILMVRDGTYLIGSTAIVTKYDVKMVYQSHIMKIRVLKPEELSPYLLLALLSSEPVLAQIKSKRITQDIIDTLGDRINEVLLPIPKDLRIKMKITSMVQKSIEERVEARELAREARALVSKPME